jgi:hypothetical protein
MSSSSALPLVLILVTTGALGVGAASQVSEMPQGLEQHLDRLLEDTVSDLTVRWLEVPHATGVVENRTVTGADLLVRLDGGADQVDLDDTVVFAPNGTERAIANATAVRDEDASMEENVITRGDLVRVVLPFGDPMTEDEERRVILEEPGKATLELFIESPRSIQGQHPTLDVQVGG